MVTSSQGWLRAIRWLPVVAALLWVALVCVLPPQTLLDSRRLAREALAHQLQADHRPDTPVILDAFNRVTEQTVLSVAWPSFVLGMTTLLTAAYGIGIQRRLDAAERNVEVLRDVIFGIDGVSLR